MDIMERQSCCQQLCLVMMLGFLFQISTAHAVQRDVSDNELLTGSCRAGYSPCQSGKCIHDTFFCDGDNDCGDNSDESIAFCRKHGCAEDHVRCDNGKCIEIEDFCSQREHCQDGSVRRNRKLCPNTEPSFDMCFEVIMKTCAPQFSEEWAGLDSWQQYQKILGNSMIAICRSAKETKRCADETLETNCHPEDVQLMPPYYHRFHSDYDMLVNIICTQEVNVIDRHKACMLGVNHDRVDMFNMIDKCVQETILQRLGCGSNEFQTCIINAVQLTCGDEMAGAVQRHKHQISYFLTHYLIQACSIFDQGDEKNIKLLKRTLMSLYKMYM